MMSTLIASVGRSPRLTSIPNIVRSQSTPTVTCAPWKPVSVKNDEPKRFVLIDSPSCTNDVNSYAWKPRKVEPRTAVAMSQSFDEPRIRSPRVRFGLSAFSTAARASTIASDDIRRTNVEVDVTGMLRIGLRRVAHVGGVHHSRGKGPTTLRP